MHSICSMRVWLLVLLALPIAGMAQSLIAFSSVRGGEPNVYLMNADGTNQRVLIANAADPAYSPDGTRIAFVRGGDIYIAAADGSGITQVTKHAPDVLVADPAFSADGRTLVFAMGPVAPDAVMNIAVVNSDGTNERTVAPNGTDPQYTPDGVRILFARGGNIMSMSTNAMAGAPYTPSPLIEHGVGVIASDPTLSRDGALLAFTIQPVVPDPVPSIHLVNVAANRQEVTLAQDAAEPAFSPSGTQLAFERGGDIWVIAVNGSMPTRLTSGPDFDGDPVWVPTP